MKRSERRGASPFKDDDEDDYLRGLKWIAEADQAERRAREMAKREGFCKALAWVSGIIMVVAFIYRVMQ
jgi:hypothetical protein